MQMLNSDDGLYTAQHVSDPILAKEGIQVSNQFISDILRNYLGAGFILIKKIPFHGNSARCLVLRQLYAQFMLQQLAEGTCINNVDQSWINETNFVRRKWWLRGLVNSVPESKVTPRFAIQMAICTEGSVFCALT